MPGEVITLQFGSYANFIGTHYWNLQVWGEGPPRAPLAHMAPPHDADPRARPRTAAG